MIRQLVEYDHERVMKLVGKKPAENLFIIGDIEAYGYFSTIQEVYGDFDGDELIAVLLNYDHQYILYSERACDYKGFAKIINADEQLKGFSGLQEIVQPLEVLITKPFKKKANTYYAKCEKLVVQDEITYDMRLTTVEDIPAHLDLLQSIPEFASNQTTEEQLKRTIDNKVGRNYAIWQDGQMVSVVSTTAENEQSAMIIGVGTREGYKRKGYASELLIQTCRELLAEGKMLCLFYDNPEAGKIYRRLGFEEIGFWQMNVY